MYRRYSENKGNGASLSQMKRNRLKNLLILLLAALLIASLALGIPAIQQRNTVRTVHIQRIQTECDDAVRQTATLSRNAGADSALILARIRSDLYTIRTINNISIQEGMGSLVSEDRILELENTVDRYLTYLTTGMDTGEYQTNLQNALEELQTELNELK